MSNMTPFEIRLELLKLAKDMLEQDYFAKREVSHNNWQVSSENARLAGTSIPNQPELPPYPSEQDVITKAASLNTFVSNITSEKPTPKKS
jgi:hypothetical protein